MNKNWPRGSEWRKWDLHIHSPGTKLSDQFASSDPDPWDAYCQKLNDSDVHAFGITDYFSADGYHSTICEFRKRYPKTSKAFFPNIELRTGDVVNRAHEEVNVHLIFNPFRLDFEEHIDEFLRVLKTNKTVGDSRHVKASELATTRDFQEATTTRESIREALVEVFGRSADLTLDVLIITAANNDGLRPERGKHRKALITDELDKFSHGFFGNAGNVAYYLGTHRHENQDETSDPKPTFSGSDAHSLADMDAKLGKTLSRDRQAIFEPTWIKADLTFEGLRQTLYEPNARVHIGDTPPAYHDEARVLKSVTLADAGGWFDELEIPLNPGLVSIIGQKGSGKSALAELIAYAAGSWVTSEPGSFIRRAGAHLKNLVIRLTWADGHVTHACLSDEQSDDNRVRYLSQKFVERLCADDHLGLELVREIEAVIFSHLDPTDTLNASDFAELRAMRTSGIREEGERLQQAVVNLIREESALQDEQRKLPDKRSRIKTLKEEEASLLKQMPRPASEEEKKLHAALQQHRDQLAVMQQAVAADKQRIQKVADIKTRVTAFRAHATRFSAELTGLLSEVGVPEAERAAFRPSFPGDTDAPLDRRTATLREQIAKQEGAVANPAEGTIRWHEARLKVLTERESVDKARQKRIKEIQTRVAAIGTEVKRLEEEIREIEGPQRERMAAAYAERVRTYGDYFENLRLEQKALHDLYEPVRKELTSEANAGSEHELEFSIRWQVDCETWLERGAELFDKRRTLPYGNFDAIEKKVREILVPAWGSGDPEHIMAAHDLFLEGFRKSELHPREYLCDGVEYRQLVEWLYEVAPVALNYGLKYNGADLGTLSPGTKGIVLLILYLGMDTADTRPLIVDQPDENLDNESIYELLRTYFERAKVRRQIILISHNPNLVINADSEQVLIATAARRRNNLPHIRYQTGSLENSVADGSGIRERACRILEGGDTAFLKREHRYAITRKIADEDTQPAAVGVKPAATTG
jgi:hypothetical protein